MAWPFSPPLSFLLFQGDTLENVAMELDAIITTGNYLFLTLDTSSSRAELMLEYIPSHKSPPTPSFPSIQLSDPELVVIIQRWNSEQINDFVRKLGFLDREKEGGDKIKHFLHVNEVCMAEICVHRNIQIGFTLFCMTQDDLYTLIHALFLNRQHTSFCFCLCV